MVVSYNAQNHFSVIFQRHGSHFTKILPHCIIVVGITVLLRLVFSGFSVSPQGHVFLNVVISFLLVARVNTALARYIQARTAIERMYDETRELAINVCMYTRTYHTQQDIEWRHEVSYRSLLLLRSIMVLLKFNENKMPIWNMPELNGTESEYVKECIMIDDSELRKSVNRRDVDTENITSPSRELIRKYHHKSRTVMDENLSVLNRIEYLLRTSIDTQSTRLTSELSFQKANRLSENVDKFMEAYSIIRVIITTPTTFPLIQLTRILLFAYVYTLPIIFLGTGGDGVVSDLVYSSVTIFFLAYGFIGLEFLAIELDDPFGTNDNDIDSDAMAEKTFEDVYLNIYDIDGPEWTDKLCARMKSA